MFAPYQCLEVAGNFLVAASGHELRTFNLETGIQTSTWACPAPLVDAKDASKAAAATEKVILEISPDSENTEAGSEDPPAKRRKISDNEKKDVKEEDISAESKKNARPKAKQLRPAVDGSSPPNFIALTASKDGRHVIAVTGEDKHVRVFEHDNGVLRQISERSMAKRPCAIALTASDSLIITADKFGDVYSLPLQVPESVNDEKPAKAASPAPQEPKQFVSSANDLTVHSARNRRALENQLKQNLVKQEKSELNAGQVLLLGHVSMLTDIALIERDGRTYIVTADRDEHIRVSRGIPQAHIIENYCFGHTDFVTKLCFPTSALHLMVSGGGDDDLFLWEWKSGKLLQKIDLVSRVEKINGVKSGGERSKVVVSGIKHLNTGEDAGRVAVTCEGVPAVFVFSLSGAGKLAFVESRPLSGNALAMATFVRSSHAALVVSVDTIHKVGSTTEVRGEEPVPTMPLEAFEFSEGNTVASSLRFQASETSVGDDVASWSSLFYALGNLRKRAGEE